MRLLLWPTLFVVLAGNTAIGGFVTLDFESLRHDDALIANHSQTYIEDGFTLTATHPEPGNVERFNSAGTLSTVFTGSTSLFHGASNGIVTLAESNGLAFTLLSIDLSELPPGVLDPHGPFSSGPFDITFVGTFGDASTVENTFTVAGFLTPTTFDFTGFENVVSVTWAQGAGGSSSPSHQFDNIVVDPVPEPSTLTLLGMGGLGMCGFRWRRKRMTTLPA